MTKREAIEIPKIERDHMTPTLLTECSETQKPLDTISRKAAIDAINNIMPTKEGLYEPSEVLCKLMQLPSVQPELEHTMEEFMYGQDLGSPEDGSL